MAGLAAFQGVDTSTDAQKAALTGLLGQMGSAGAESFKADQAVGQHMAQAGRQAVVGSNPGIGNPAASSAVGPGQLTQMLAARAAEPGATSAALAGQAGAEFNKYAGLLQSGNANYMNAVKAAAPIVQSQTQSQVSQIMADLADKREQRAYEAEQRRQEAEDRALGRKEHAEDRAYELGKRKDEQGIGGVKPRSVGDVGKAMGLSREQTEGGASDPMYGILSEAAAGLIERFPDMDYGQLASMLQGVAKDNAPDYPGGHTAALALVIGQNAPLVGGRTGGKTSLDYGYEAYGKTHAQVLKTLADRRKAIADAKAAEAAAAQQAHEQARAEQAQAAANRAERDRLRGVPKGGGTTLKTMTTSQLKRKLGTLRSGTPEYTAVYNELGYRGAR